MVKRLLRFRLVIQSLLPKQILLHCEATRTLVQVCRGATVDSDLINLLGGPLGPGTYSVWIQQLGALTDYTFELQTTYNKPIVWTRLLGTPTYNEDRATALTTGTDGAIYVGLAVLAGV
jgi:hypothetical protein